jgi:ParB family chromosome partitioning protein
MGTSLLGIVDEIEIRKIRPSSQPIRDDLGSLEELAASIREKGLLHPIVVRHVRDGFEVVAGNRRLEACKMLGIKHVPCHIVELDDKEAYEASLIENIQRKTLNPIEEAKAFKKYVDEYGYGSISELARKIGKSHSYVSRRIALLKLPKTIQEALVRRRITPSVAQELLSLDEGVKEQIGEFATKERITVQVARRLVRHIKEERSVYELWSQPSLAEDEHTQKIERAIRAIDKCLASLRVCLMRVDDVVDSFEEEWMLREIMMVHRIAIHGMIDNLIKLKKKLRYVSRDMYSQVTSERLWPFR